MFNEDELRKIKELALENHIPIIMDDTLEEVTEEEYKLAIEAANNVF